MKFKTRDNISPQGIPKVYYTAHPKDFSVYFDTISDLILKYQNCAVFFDSDPEQPEDLAPSSDLLEDKEDFYPFLYDMQLIVIPITINFLEQECFARSKALVYALKHHIPILPILEDTGIESKFNEVCGDLHFLNPYEYDPTAIPFEVKLSKYLKSVLIGDELAEKIRAAFEAYIFISYRKKDRKEAQKLMRLIHEHKFCRDIALWYDEYLVPGEDFNQAIQEAMQKSNLFALTVTPNLLEHPNYVMQHEFPDARDAGMKILPVEMQETNQEQLKTDYKGIPNCIKIGDALTKSLFSSFGNAGKNQNPEHEFFIGLAYLDGVDMEVNRERAVELITSAASQNFPEAMKKLIHMYTYGEGVKCDFSQISFWHQKIADFYAQQYQQKQTETSAYNWINILNYIGKNLEILMQLNDALSVYQNMLEAAQAVNQQFSSVQTWNYLAESYDSLAKIYKKIGKNHDAKQYIEESIAVFRKIDENSASYSSKMNLITAYNHLADSCTEEGNLTEAIQYYKICLDFYEKIDSKSHDKLLNLAVIYQKLGTAQSGNPEMSRTYLEKSLEICLSLSTKIDTREVKEALYRAYHELGKNYLKANERITAMQYYKNAIEIIVSLAETARFIEYQKNAAETFYSMGLIDTAQEEKWMKNSYSIWFELFKKLGSTHPDVFFNFKLTKRYCEINEIKKRIELSHQPGDYDSLAIAYWDMADIEQSQETKWVQFAYGIWKQLSEAYPAITELTSRTEMAAERLRKLKLSEIDEIKKRIELSHQPKDYDSLAIAYWDMADIEQSQETKWVQFAYGIWKQLSEAYPAITELTSRTEMAAERLRKLKLSEIDKIKKRIELSHQPKDYDSLAIAYCDMGDLEQSQETKWVQFAYGIWKQLSEAYPAITELTSRTEMAAERLRKLITK